MDTLILTRRTIVPRQYGVRRRPMWERRIEQERAIARRVARHESYPGAKQVPLIMGRTNTAKRIDNAERFAPAWLRDYPDQAAA